MSNFVEIAPRELKPALLELDGISRASVEAHHRLYQGYVSKRNEILRRLQQSTSAAPIRSIRTSGRSRWTSRSHSAASRTTRSTSRTSAARAAIRPAPPAVDRTDFGSVEAWRDDLRATGLAGRGWAWTAYDWDEQRLFNLIGDAQNTYPVWNATPLVALDVYEHAYFLDFQTDRGAYIEAFFQNLDWDVVNGWIETYAIPR